MNFASGGSGILEHTGKKLWVSFYLFVKTEDPIDHIFTKPKTTELTILIFVGIKLHNVGENCTSERTDSTI